MVPRPMPGGAGECVPWTMPRTLALSGRCAARTGARVRPCRRCRTLLAQLNRHICDRRTAFSDQMTGSHVEYSRQRRGSSSLTSSRLRRGDRHRALLTGHLDVVMTTLHTNVGVVAGIETITDADASAYCSCCPHPVERHDRVARRYCEATLHRVLTRRCICRGDMVDVEQEPASAHRFP
jgi:hypothetical protein